MNSHRIESANRLRTGFFLELGDSLPFVPEGSLSDGLREYASLD